MSGLKPVEIEVLQPSFTRLIGLGATTAGCAAPLPSNMLSKVFSGLFDACVATCFSPYMIRSKAVEQNFRLRQTKQDDSNFETTNPPVKAVRVFQNRGRSPGRGRFPLDRNQGEKVNTSLVPTDQQKPGGRRPPESPLGGCFPKSGIFWFSVKLHLRLAFANFSKNCPDFRNRPSGGPKRVRTAGFGLLRLKISIQVVYMTLRASKHVDFQIKPISSLVS